MPLGSVPAASLWYDVGDTLLDRNVYFYAAAYSRIREGPKGGPTPSRTNQTGYSRLGHRA